MNWVEQPLVSGCTVTAEPSLVRACWQMMWVGFCPVTVGSGLITWACRVGHESGLLVVEE